MITVIETPRLALRHWKESDMVPFIRMNADTEVMRYFPEPYEEDRTRCFYDAIITEFSDYGYGLYAAEEKNSGGFIGFIGFHRANFKAAFCPCIEIGWRLDKSFWNRGYAAEGANACLKYGFEYLGFDRVYSFTAVENLPSQRVMQKIGMRLEQYFDHPDVQDGHPLKPHVCYTITKKDMVL
ncbi:GNAT family N-acetyltransferase [Brucepastera parasyntrophica]|uniref:GNAT family N-acetyltransferase n=1 Tax=Brucepastera parasyntrophica TaxID=2880008 RepID=UPI00210B8C0B|nr:GNAT family N-acetyltransferase [Brucepastera parasyntrophica]ULQ60435.1 GNAT family N-acetyltransferase [Brucepastera parasyntrophica]